MDSFYHAVGHAHSPVAIGGKILVVCDYEERSAHVAAQVEEQAVQLGAVAGVETARRLVGKHHGRTVDERPRNGATLRFAP